MCWVVLVFFAISLVILYFDEDKRAAVLWTPVWFLIIIPCYFINKKARGGKSASAQDVAQ